MKDQLERNDQPKLAHVWERRTRRLEISARGGWEVAPEVGSDPERGRKAARWREVCLWHTTELLLRMLEERSVAASLGVIR